MNLFLQQAIRAAIDAGEKILEIYNNSDFTIDFKDDNSPLTDADKAAHEIITAHLAGTFPIVSEEGKNIPREIRRTWDTFWLVDPLDGTKEFIKRNGEFTVNIALIEHGTPVMGVIFVPVLDELYFADHEGSFKCNIKNIRKGEDNSLVINNQVKLPFESARTSYVVVGSRSHLTIETEKFINEIDTQGKQIEMVSKGSSLKLCMVASGEADIYPRLGPTMEWDIAAGHAIAAFAGKKVTRIDGKPMTYNKENLLNPFFVVA